MARGYPDFEGDKSGVYLTPEWAAKEGVDKTIVVSKQDAAWGEFGSTTYTVPTAKTLYLNNMSFTIHAENAADYDHSLYGVAWLVIGATTYATLGGLGGGSVTFPKPVKLVAGEVLGVLVANYSNVDCRLVVTVAGYEV